MIWRIGAIMVAVLVALPMLGILASLLDWRGAMWRHLVDTQLADILSNTALLLLGVGIGTTAIGTAAAWVVTMHRFPLSRTFEWALLLPMVMPTYIIGYAYADLLAYAGPLQGLLRDITGWQKGDYWFPDAGSATGVACLFSLVLYPYVYLAARAAFLAQSQPLLDASRILGHGPWRTFLSVGLPLARPAIAAGAALALLEALADFGTVQYYGVHTFTTAIYRTWFGMGDRQGAGQIAVILLVIAVVLVLVERHSRGRARYHVAANLRERAEPTALSTRWGALAGVLCALPVLLGFVLPTTHLIQLAMRANVALTGPAFLRETLHSLVLAAVAAIVIAALGVFLAYAGRLVHQRNFNRLIEFAALGYALPGAVIAVGILLPLVAADRALDRAGQALFGVSIGLILSGTVVALLLAYTVRFLAVGIANISPGLAAIDPAMDASARILGAQPLEILRRIHLPNMRGPAITALLVAFVEVMKELPATLLIRPFNFDTLAVGVYRYASDERLAEAAVGAVAIVAVSLLPVILLSRAIAGRAGTAGATSSRPVP
jgi:iron(III) transport system permease protein